jgi:hemerythrin
MANPIRWTKECRLGIDDIDSQHRLLYAIAGEIQEIDNPEEQGPEIKYFIDHVRKYIKEHFEFEEAFMEQIGYPGLNEHRKIHKIIVEEINHTLTSSKNLTAMTQQIDYLMNIWVKDHILIQDRKYAEWYYSNMKNSDKNQ